VPIGSWFALLLQPPTQVKNPRTSDKTHIQILKLKGKIFLKKKSLKILRIRKSGVIM
jgi:hypothetical protein